MNGIPLETTRAPRRGGRSGKHRYEGVIELIHAKIASEDMGPGSRLPSNTELADEAGVSLITVRRALDELERDGEIVRYQGVGTFVARGRIVSEPTKRGELAPASPAAAPVRRLPRASFWNPMTWSGAWRGCGSSAISR